MKKKCLKVQLPLVSLFAFVLVVLFSTSTIKAQPNGSGILKGRVTDAKSQPVTGATVIIKGTTNGTITNIDGEYTLSDVPDKCVLVFSFVGMKQVEKPVAGENVVNVILEEDAIGLDEVVAIGYGVVRKSDLTGSLTSVTSKDISSQPVITLANAIQGRAPGVVVSNVSGTPGASAKIRIRGSNSILGGNDPLFVVDGMMTGGINDLNVNDIESIEILKDASATAIYGSKGANGVVLITTKRGTNQEASVTANANIGWGTVPYKYDVLDATSFATLYNQYKDGTFTDEDIAGFTKNGGTNWQDQVFRVGKTQNYDVNISGGNKTSSYYISGNYIDQTGIVNNTRETKYSLRSNLSTSIGKRLKVDFNMNAARTDGYNNDGSSNGSLGSPVFLASIYAPTYPVYESEGLWSLNDYSSLTTLKAGNPLMSLMERKIDKITNTFAANAKLSYQIIEGLRLDVTLGTANTSSQTAIFNNDWFSLGDVKKTSGSLEEQKYYNLQNSNVLTFTKRLSENHDFTIMVGNEQTYDLASGFGAYGTGIDPVLLSYYALQRSSTLQTIGSNWSSRTMQSYFGRVSYSLLGRYLFTATYRADGSSVFQGGNKWGYFPSGAIGWRVSEEPFMKNQSVVNNLKLRASIGVTGNQNISTYGTFALLADMPFSFGGAKPIPGSMYTGVDNPNLKWESTTQYNYGGDISFLDGRIGITADYYIKNTDDLLLGVVLPYYNGGNPKSDPLKVNSNVGKIQNEGYEITVFATPVAKKDLKWDISFNISAYQNKVVALSGNDTLMFDPSNPTAALISGQSLFPIKVGEPLGGIWGYTYMGVWTSADSLEAKTYGAKPGDRRYQDLDGDHKISASDQKIIGYSTPKFVWGLSNNFSFKGFELNILVQSAVGRKMLNTLYAAGTTKTPQAPAITMADGVDYWTYDNQDAAFANIKSRYQNNINSTEYFQDASYVKIKNIGLSYNFKKKDLKLADVKLSVSAQNLFTFTNYKGYDPETSTTTSDTQGAMDLGAYPNPRMVTVGLQVKF